MPFLFRCALIFTVCCNSVYSKYISDGQGDRTNIDYLQDKYPPKNIHHKINQLPEEPRLERHHEDYSSEEIFNSLETPLPSTKKRQHPKNEKYKCMVKYDLEENNSKDRHQTENLKEEVVKLQDLVQILKDQQSILKILNEVGTKELKNTQEAKIVNDEEARTEIKKLKEDVEKIKNVHSQLFETISLGQLARIIPNEEILEHEVSQQSKEFLNLKKRLEDLYRSNHTDLENKIDDLTKPKQNVTDMLEEINLIKSRLSELQSKDVQKDNEVVGAIFRPNLIPRINKTVNFNKTKSTSARASNTEEMNILANLLGENKELDSTETEGKGGSLEIGDGDEFREKLLFDLLVKNKEKNKINNLEDQLKKIQKMVKKIEGIESKTLLSEEENDDKNRIKKLELAIKKLSKKDKIQSKSLDNDDINLELKGLEKAIKNLQTGNDNELNLDSAEDKNLDFQFLLDKIAKPQKIQKPQLTPTQVQLLIKKLMKKKGHHHSTNNEESYHNGHKPPLNIYSYEEVDDDSSEQGGHSGSYHHNYESHGHKHIPIKYGYQNFDPNYNPYNPNPYHQYYPSQTYSNNFEYSNIPGNTKQYINPYSYTNKNTPPNNPSSYSTHNNNYNYQNDYSPPPSSNKYQSGYPSSGSYTSSNIYGSPIKNDYSSSKYVDNQPKPDSDNLFHDTHKPYPSTNTNSGTSDYGEAEKSYSQNSQQSYANPPGNPNDYTHESIKDLKYQIEELQNVINTMNKPEYTQKPDDKETVYSLNEQITDLKGAISNINTAPPSTVDKNYQNTQNYENSNNNVNSNVNPNQEENTYNNVDKAPDYTPVTRNQQTSHRHKSSRRIGRDYNEMGEPSDRNSKISPPIVSKFTEGEIGLLDKLRARVFKRETEDSSEDEDGEALGAITSLLQGVISQSSENLEPNLSEVNIGDISRRVADLRKQSPN